MPAGVLGLGRRSSSMQRTASRRLPIAEVSAQFSVPTLQLFFVGDMEE
eukprot:COSAG06_NODE_152_length_21942_cov_4.593234_6_plen_48_part_00